MTRGYLRGRAHVALIAVSFAVAVIAVAGKAEASCFPTSGQRLLPKGAPVAFGGTAAGGAAGPAADDARPSGDTLVGLWEVEFLIGNGPDVFDHSFQQFHDDGTEMMLSRGLPPALGNVCVGIWKQTGPRAFKVRHVTWNWDADGHYISTFALEVAIRVDKRGNGYTGTWKSDNLDPATGAPIAGEHFEGTVSATRIGFD